jgi:uncharacterized membrane protein (DUF2068 family)
MTTPDPRPKLSAGFIWIIAFKCVKATAFLVIGAAALHLARLPRHSGPLEIAHFLGAHTTEIVVQHVSQILDALSSGQIQAIGAASILIALVFAAEGTALALRIPWAPYFTIVLTALGIPAELVEIARRPESYRRYALLAVNVAILVYLWKRRNEFRTPAAER